MQRSDTCAEFGPGDAAWPVRLARHVRQRSHDQVLVAVSSGLAELLVCPREDAQDMTLRGIRQPKAETSARSLGALRRATPQLCDEVLKLIIGHIDVPTDGHVRPTLTRRLLQGLELGGLPALSLLDESQPLSQNLAGVLGACRAWGASAAIWPQRSIFHRFLGP